MGAIAAGKLPDGYAIAITFQNTEAKNRYLPNGEWINTAVRKSAKKAKLTFEVLRKGMLKRAERCC